MVHCDFVRQPNSMGGIVCSVLSWPCLFYRYTDVRLLSQAVNGLGCDRHMLGLKLAAIENGMDVPEIFMDGSWSRSTHMKLSTSQVRTTCHSADNVAQFPVPRYLLNLTSFRGSLPPVDFALNLILLLKYIFLVLFIPVI